MKVKSKLANVDFHCGTIEREGHQLIVYSHESQAMKTVVYVSPSDTLTFLFSLLRSPSALQFIIAFPYFWWRARKEIKSSSTNPADPW